jgi:curved DNA-binding protein CbpA
MAETKDPVAAGVRESEASIAEQRAAAPDARRDPAAVVKRWAGALEKADYFTLLELPVPKEGSREITDSELRQAFHRFAQRFHPDHYRSSDPEAREAAATVFGRGSEAYRVLRDLRLRKAYVKKLAGGGLRLGHGDILEAERPPKNTSKLVDIVTLPMSRQFAAKADDLIAAGKLAQAKVQLGILQMREPNNALLNARIQEINDAAAAQGASKPQGG